MGSGGDAAMYKMRRLENGMITVEAAMILPIVFFVLILILYFFFYSYESGVAAGVLREEMTKAASEFQREEKQKETVSKCKDNIKRQLSQKSLFGSGTKVEVIRKGNELEGSIKSKIDVPVVGAIFVGGVSFFEVSQRTKVKIRKTEERIWRWQQSE